MSEDNLAWSERAQKETLDVLGALHLHRSTAVEKEVPLASLGSPLAKSSVLGVPSISLEADNETVVKQPLPDDKAQAYTMAISAVARAGQIKDVHRLVEAASEELTEVQMVQLLAAVVHHMTLMEREIMKLIRTRGHHTPRVRLHNFPKKEGST